MTSFAEGHAAFRFLKDSLNFVVKPPDIHFKLGKNWPRSELLKNNGKEMKTESKEIYFDPPNSNKCHLDLDSFFDLILFNNPALDKYLTLIERR